MKKFICFTIVLIFHFQYVLSQSLLDKIWDAYEARDMETVVKLGKPLADRKEKSQEVIDVLAIVGHSYKKLNKMKESFHYFQLAGENGSSFACMHLGFLYANGEYVKKDLDKAEFWFKKCLDGNNDRYAAQVCTTLGQIYLDTGRNNESESYFKKAMSKGGNKMAPVFLAENFCKREEEKALGYYRIAAENGNYYAMKKVGEYFEDGKYVEKDYIEAAKWYERSYYENSNWEEQQETMNKLGRIYEKQYRKTMDERVLKKSLKWYYKSVEFNPFGAMEARFSQDDTIAVAIDPIHRFYEEGVLEAYKYKDFEQWKENVVSKLAIDSDVDVNIPSNIDKPSNTFVLIIANENYEYEQFVPYAENDGTIFAKYCAQTLGIPEKNIHTIIDAGLNKMKRELDWLVTNAPIQKANKIIFYYSGHGVPAEDLSTSYLLPIDGYAKNPSTGFDLKEICRELGKINNVESLVFLDACFSGAKRKGGMLVESKGVSIKPKQVQPQGNMVVMSACQGTETAYPIEDQKHGLFTYYLLKKLQLSKGNISIPNLFSYVKQNVLTESVKNNKSAQTPSLISSGDLNLGDINIR